VQYFEAFLCCTQMSEERGWDTPYVKVKPFWGVTDVVAAWLRQIGSPRVNRALSLGTVAVRELFYSHPETARSRTARNSYVAVVMDWLIWPLLSLAFKLVRLAGEFRFWIVVGTVVAVARRLLRRRWAVYRALL